MYFPLLIDEIELTIITTVFPLQFLVIIKSYCCDTEYYVVLLQKPQKKPLKVFCKRSYS